MENIVIFIILLAGGKFSEGDRLGMLELFGIIGGLLSFIVCAVLDMEKQIADQ